MRLPAIALLVCTAAAATAQGGRIEVLHADEWTFDRDRLPGVQVLRGAVRFRHADAEMHCDSAHLHDGQRVEAFGRIRIAQGDSLRMSGSRLDYDGHERMARFTGDVRLEDGALELVTPGLAYDLRARRATYTAGGRLTDRRDGTVLTSRTGSYLAQERLLLFSGNVRLEHPDRTIEADSLRHSPATGTVFFTGPTILRGKDLTVRTTRGTYDTRNERAVFTERTRVEDRGRVLEGDSLRYDRRAGTGTARGRVLLTDTASSHRVTGATGSYDERSDLSWVTGRAELLLDMDGDTLHLHADTLFTTGSAHGRSMEARRGVRFFQRGMQGACDTLIFHQADSTLHLLHRPVLWNGTGQTTGQRIRIALKNGRAHRLFVDHDAFLMAEAGDDAFDQVSGTTMTGSFADGELRSILAEGNCRTVYHVREEKDDGRTEAVGVNRADCSRIRVELGKGEVVSVTFLDKPEAVLHPPGRVPPEELRMKGAEWRGAERPRDRQDIFRRPSPGP